MYWAALVVDSIKHPLWWPRTDPSLCVGRGDVPNFNQVIIGSGPTDIGIHIDSAKPVLTPPPSLRDLSLSDACDDDQNAGDLIAGVNHVNETPANATQNFDYVDPADGQYSSCLCDGPRVHVDTYFTVARGRKNVIMLPSGGNFFGEKVPFPRDLTPDLIESILSRGGYFFSLEAISDTQFLTVFTPKGWHHWLLGMTDWHLIYGASRF